MKLSMKKIAAIVQNQLSKINELYRSRNFDQVAIRNQRLWDFIDHLDDCEFWWQCQYQGQRDAGVPFWKYDLNPWEVIQTCERIQQLYGCGREEEALVACTALLDRCDEFGVGNIVRPVIFGYVPHCFSGSWRCERRLLPRWKCSYMGSTVTVRARSEREAQFEAAQLLMDITAIQAEPLVDNSSKVPSYV